MTHGRLLKWHPSDLLPEPGPDVRVRLEALLARVQRIRKNCYPEGWDADPLWRVEQEIAGLLNDMKHA